MGSTPITPTISPAKKQSSTSQLQRGNEEGNDMQDTGEFLALTIPGEQEILSAVEWKNQAFKLRKGLEKIAKMHHQNAHRMQWGIIKAPAQFMVCTHTSCREARNLLDIGDRGGY